MNPFARIKLRVAHKGLIIVAVALFLELLLVGSLTFLLTLTDKEHMSEAAHRDKAMYSARLMFADVDAGVALVCAWRMRETSALEDLNTAIERAKSASKKIRAINEENHQNWRTSDYQTAAMADQDKALELIQRIGDITAEGFTFENLRRVWVVQQELNGVLRDTFSILHKWYLQTEQIMAENERNLRMLMWLQTSVVVGGLAVQALAAYFLFGFFTRQFIHTIELLRMNVDRMSQKYPLSQPLAGHDEIAELDQSFRTMYDELTLAAEREQALFDNASDVICILDEQFEIEKVNSASQRLWGYPAYWLMGSSVARFIPDNHWVNMKSALEDSRFGAPAANFECDVTTQSGTPMRSLWSTFWSEQNRCWFCVVHDISEQHRLEKMRESFLSMIARDLQEPLQRIYMLFERLAAGATFNESATVKVNNSLNTLKRLTNLVGEILDFERLQSPESHLEQGEHNVQETLAAAARDVESLAIAKTVSIEVECDPKTVAVCDQSKLVRVLVNLLSNAIKYSPEGTTIRVTAETTDRILTVNVKDQGPGIPQSAAQNLFKPFQQVNVSDAKRGKGTGLGLVICKRLVEMHHGQIGVDSTPGRGSTFWFSVPLSGTAELAVASEHQPADAEVSIVADSASQPVQQTVDETSAVMQTESSEHPPQKNVFALVETLGLKRVRLYLVGLPLGFECVMVAVLCAFLITGNAERQREIQERDCVLSAIHLCVGYLETVISVFGTTGRTNPHQMQEAIDSLPKRSYRLRELAQQNPQARKEIAAILKTTDKLEPLTREIGQRLTEMAASGNTIFLGGAHDKLLIICSKIEQPVVAFLDGCQPRVRVSPEKQRFIRQQQGAVMAAGMLFNILLAIGGASIFANSIARRLRIMATNTTRLAHDQELLPPVSGSDEIAQLDASFHTMAARLKEQRKKERAYLDNSRDVIGAFDAELCLLTLNPAAKTLWGMEVQEMIGTSVLRLFPEKQRQAFEDVLSGLRISEAQGVGQMESQMAMSESMHMIWSISWSVKEQCYFFVAHDISKRKELERMKKEFIAVVSHDLRSPLGTIYGTTELMLHGVFGELAQSSRDILSDVNVQVNQMLELINDLLDLEKLNAGQMQLAHTRVKLSELFDKAVLLVDAAISLKEQSLHLPPSQHEMVVDADRVSQAFANLLLEMSALIPDGAQLNVQASATKTGDTQITITASDSTLSGEQMRVLQSRLDNMHSATQARNQASRLRLPLAKTIIESHHGTLQARLNKHGQPAFYITMLTNPEHSMFQSRTRTPAILRTTPELEHMEATP